MEKSKRLIVRMSPEELEKVQALAESQNLTTSDLVRNIMAVLTPEDASAIIDKDYVLARGTEMITSVAVLMNSLGECWRALKEIRAYIEAHEKGLGYQVINTYAFKKTRENPTDMQDLVTMLSVIRTTIMATAQAILDDVEALGEDGSDS